jgi:protein SCO1/2
MKLYFPILAIVILISFGCSNVKETENLQSNFVLPIFGEKKLANATGTDTIYHSIPSFELTNQFGEKVNENTLQNKIYVADFFFATCQSICPKMNRQMKRIQDSLKTDSKVLLLSHTVNPIHDTVEVLTEYGAKYGAIKNKWHLLTGAKKSIYDLAKIGYLINAVEDDGSEEGFIHSEYILLIDTQKRIRGFYDGTDSIVVNQLIKDIKLLETEK